jgi:predicted phosphodiesterase
MRIAVISDIHGNLEALREVLSDIDRSNTGRIISLGDNIGYGPEPEGVLHLLQERSIPSVMGNHELGAVNPSCAALLNPCARRSLELTQELLSPTSLAHIGTMQIRLVEGGCLFVHGSPPDSPNRYFLEASLDEKRCIFLKMREDICFVGHTHALALVSFDGERVEHDLFPEGVIHLPKGRKYIINAGSVGQPRDGDSRAKYILWDDRTRRLEVHMVPYDVGKTARKILDLGFPGRNADCLW